MENTDQQILDALSYVDKNDIHVPLYDRPEGVAVDDELDDNCYTKEDIRCFRLIAQGLRHGIIDNKEFRNRNNEVSNLQIDKYEIL